MKTIERIFLIGHPAVGKAYFGKALADELGYQFIDADLGLEHQIGLPLQQIIGTSGLENYQQTQQNILTNLSNRQGIVAGLDCFIANSDQILASLKSAVVILMHTSIETQLRRSGAHHETLTNKIDYATLIKSLHDERDEYFHQISDYVLAVDNGDIADHIYELKNFFTKEQYTLTPSSGLSEKALVFLNIIQIYQYASLSNKQYV